MCTALVPVSDSSGTPRRSTSDNNNKTIHPQVRTTKKHNRLNILANEAETVDNAAYYIRLRKKKDRKQDQVGEEKYLNGKCIESE